MCSAFVNPEGRGVKSVTHVYRTACSTVKQPPGFGDYLRGSISLAILALDHDFHLNLDLSNHPIGRFLHANTVQTEPSGDIVEFFNERAPMLPKFIEGLGRDTSVFVTTHLSPDIDRINDQVRDLVREQLIFDLTIESTALSLASKISDGEFAILHVRVADEHFQSRSPQVRQLYDYIEEHLLPTWGRRLAVLSNNKAVKEVLSARYNLLYIDTGMVHLGECNSTESDVRDTLIDFSLMSKASAIFSYSVYSWKSGFSSWCACLFNVPFVEIRLSPDDGASAARMLLGRMKKTIRAMLS